MGVVHHSNYYPWFEVGRTEFIKHSGMSYSEIENQGVMIPLVESYCKYIEGAKYEDELVIQTWIEELKSIKAVFKYNVVRERDGKILAKGSTTHAFVGENFKIINLQKKHSEIWDRLNKLYID
jgi:acyl-CoA thioester hydrolase